MDSRPKSRSQRRRKLRDPKSGPLGERDPYNRVYREYPENISEDGTTEDLVEVRIKFYITRDINCIRWVYCWAGSPVQHCQVYIDGLIHNIDANVPSHWMVEELYMGDKPGGSYELAKELVFNVPRNLVDWDKIRAVSEGFQIRIYRTMFWGLFRHSRGGSHIPKPSPDCVSISRQILGTLGIWASGELPWELYESLVSAYKPEEISYRSFK